MGTSLNFQDFGNEPAVEGSGSGRPPGNFPLVRQSSVYSLTFDEFQSTLGKDFGSMNMDELLKNIWSAEETQNVASTAVATSCGGVQNGGNFSQGGGYNLQRQGSLTLPRTLSHKTVDEVWRDMAKEYCTEKVAGSGVAMPQAQRQPTLGEITLEEFLVKAGAVREDAQLGGGFLGGVAQPNNNNTGFGISFQQPNHGAGAGLMGSRIAENNAQISLQSPNLPLNGNGVRSSQYQSIAPVAPQQQQHQHQQIFPKQDTVSYAPPMAIPIHSSSQLASPVIRPGIAELVNSTINGNFAKRPALQGGGMGILGMVGAGMGVNNGSPANLPSNGLKSNGDAHTPSVSPVPYMFNGGLRGRKSNSAMEKVIERRHRRMIKNRESAARSRQRKQAYTTELEQEVAKLKEENEELRKKQAQIMEMQENQALETIDAQYGAKRRCLRRTQTGPW